MNIPRIADVNTRTVVCELKKAEKLLKGSIIPIPDDHAFDQLHATVLTNQQVAQVSTPKPYPNPGTGLSVVVTDFGLKDRILRGLSRRKCNITVSPYTATAEEILRLDPDGVMLSNGSGNPNSVCRSALEMIRTVQTKVPMFAIGLGHGLLGIANGANVQQIPVEHHGVNHPIHEIITNHIVYATQAEGYLIDRNSVDRSQLFITYVDMLDNSIQGLRHRRYPAFLVQFFPDGTSGPDETDSLLDEFVDTMNRRGDHH